MPELRACVLHRTQGHPTVRSHGGRSKRLLSVRTSSKSKLRDNTQNRFQQTLNWARSLLRSQLASGKADDAIHLGYLSLLIAIEDAAAAEIYFDTDPSLFEQAILRQYWGIPPEHRKQIDEEYDLTMVSEAPILGGLGSASTWNLARLDTLAQEVEASLRNNLLPGSPDENSTNAGSEIVREVQVWDCRRHAQRYPMLAINAVNEVLFEQHGYQGKHAKEDPRLRMILDCRYHQLPHVMEQGGGSPAVLTILYLEICARIGLPMKAALLEEGRYAVLWPVAGPLMLAGEEVVIDVFSEGALFLLSEVRQLFDLSEEPLMPATNREIICALLSGLRDVHWCKAIGGKADPLKIDAVPLTIDAVLDGEYPKRSGYQMERAIAAAERCCWVLPKERSYKKILAVLLYSANQHAKALQALAHVHEGSDIQDFKFLLRTLNRAQKRNIITA